MTQNHKRTPRHEPSGCLCHSTECLDCGTRSLRQSYPLPVGDSGTEKAKGLPDQSLSLTFVIEDRE